AAQLLAFTDHVDARAAAWLPLVLTYARARLRPREATPPEVDAFVPGGGGTLHVRQAVNNETRRIGTPKHGPRVVELRLSPLLVDVLREQATAGSEEHTAALH